MIRNLPKSLLESATNHLSEAVALKTHIEMAKKASRSTKVGNKTRAEILSQHAIPLGQDTTVLPLERDTARPHPDVVDHLDENGYEVHDYMKGLAIKKGQKKNPISIGKVLARTNAPQSLRTAYEKDPNRQGIDSSVHVVISRNPVHVAGASTHQNWESCQTLGGGGKDGDENLPKQDRGSESHYIPHDIAAGSHVAYLVHNPEDVDKHYAPIARIMLKPYVSEHGHTILKPMQTYGDEWNGFHSTVAKWANKHFPEKDAQYKMDDTVYPDGPKYVRNLAPEHDDYWMKHKEQSVMNMHPSEKVINHYLNEVDRPIAGIPLEAHHRMSARYDLHELAKNPHLNEDQVMRILNHPASMTHTKDSLYNNYPSNKVVEHGMAYPEFHNPITTNPNLTTENIETLLHQHKDVFENSPEHESLPNNYGGILNNISNHPNLSEHQANYLIKLPRSLQYPGAMRGLFAKASDEHVKNAIDELNDPNASHNYYEKAYASLVKHKPHMLKDVPNIMLYFAHNGLPRTSKATHNLEQEMISRGPMFHRRLASSYYPEHVQHVIDNTTDDGIKRNAMAQLEWLK